MRQYVAAKELLRDDVTTVRASAGAFPIRRSEMPATSEAAGERLNIPLIPAARAKLRLLQERTDLSRTDLANRAITLYEFFDAQMRADCDLVSRDRKTGKTQLVWLLEAPAGPAGQKAPAGPARKRRGPAGRHRRLHLSLSGPAITGRLVPLVGLAGQEARAR